MTSTRPRAALPCPSQVEDLGLKDFESKRDRWNGYDSGDYARVVDRFEQLDNIRKEIKKKEQVRAVSVGWGLDGRRWGEH